MWTLLYYSVIITLITNLFGFGKQFAMHVHWATSAHLSEFPLARCAPRDHLDNLSLARYGQRRSKHYAIQPIRRQKPSAPTNLNFQVEIVSSIGCVGSMQMDHHQHHSHTHLSLV
ncbi:hypothetical protein QBC44DRAFT_329512 [Cladorrhinum sp. PSN332]|nr:hypothetical protein QBC44DRAFT_329512 [Cladorrhinum sp. PSN332]